jgi:hypothetical protein
MTLNLNGATTKGECETPSSVTGAGVCRVEAVSEWFSTTNEQVGQATISYQYDSVTYGTSLTQQFTLKKHYEHDAVSEPTIILEAPKYPVFEGEESVVEVFVNTGDYGLYAGDFEILISDAGNGEQWDSTFEYVGFTSSGIWQAKAGEAIPGYLISVVFLSPSTNVLEEETKGTKLKIGEITLRQKITSYTSSFGTYACVAGSSWFDCDQGLLSATVRQMANWGLRTYVPTGTASVVNSYSRSAPSGGLEPGLVSSTKQVKMYSAIGQTDLVNAYPITSDVRPRAS